MNWPEASGYAHLAVHPSAERLALALRELDSTLDKAGWRLSAGEDSLAGGFAPFQPDREGIVTVSVSGLLIPRGMYYGNGWITSYDAIPAILDRVQARSDASGVILDIDSAGGCANGCFSAARHIRDCPLPVAAVANPLAYSAAYALASGARRIFAEEDSGLGSIGVISLHVDCSEAMKRAGLVAKGDRPAQVARKVKDAINRSLDLQVNYQGAVLGERLPDGMVLTIQPMASGAGDPSMARLIPKIGDEEWSVIVCPYTDGDAGLVLAEEMARRWRADTQLYRGAFSARTGSIDALLAYGQTLNCPYMSVLGAAHCPSPPWEIAAAYAGQAANSFAIDPARPLQTLPLTGIGAPAMNDRLKIPDANALLYGGIATSMVQGGCVRIQREISAYRVNEWGEPDPSYLDMTTIYTLSYYVRSLRRRIALKFPRAKLANDGARVRPGSAMVTPAIIRAECIAHYSELERLGLMENMTDFVENLAVERDERDPNRINLFLPPDLVNQLRFIAGAVQFRLQLPNRWGCNMVKTVKLNHPLQAHGEWVTELAIPQRITLGHLMAMDGADGEMGKIAGLIAGVCSIPLSSARMLDLEDLEAVMAELGPFSKSGGLGGRALQESSPISTAGPPQKRKP